MSTIQFIYLAALLAGLAYAVVSLLMGDLMGADGDSVGHDFDLGGHDVDVAGHEVDTGQQDHPGSGERDSATAAGDRGAVRPGPAKAALRVAQAG